MDYSPYAPPAAGPPADVAVHRPLAWKTTAAAVAMAASLATAVLLQGVTLALGPPSPKDLLGLALMGILSLVTQAVGLAAPILFLIWIYQASKNVHAFGRLGLAFTPGWCVGWWFIPIASLWMPYQVMKEIFRASAPTADLGPDAHVAWGSQKVPATFPLWWATYVSSGFVSIAGGVVSVAATLKHEPPPASAILLIGISLFLSAMSAVSVVSIMRIIHRRQEATAAQLAEAAPAPPT